MKIALSFLGTSKYEMTTYQFEGKTYQTKFVQTAIRDHFKVDGHYIFVTEASMAIHGQSLLDLGYKKSHLINVPDGKSEQELWELFTIISEIVPEDSDVVFDVTHGFRIQPMLALAVLVYLRFYKKVRVNRVCYGLFEKSTDVNNILDVTPFLEIIDWSLAVRRFTEKGDASDLADVMRKYHVATYQKNLDYKAVSLSSTGNALKSLMESLSMVRPEEVALKSKDVSHCSTEIQTDMDHIYQTKPLAHILETIKQKVSDFEMNLDSKDKPELFSSQGIQAQLNMCGHYLKVGMYQQCLTLATELIFSVSLVLHNEDPLDEKKRNSVSFRLQSICRNEHIGPIELWEQDAGELLRFASDIRNDVNHAGMRKDPKPAKSHIINTKKLFDKLTLFLFKNKLINK